MQYTLIGIECLTKHLRKSEKRLRKLQKDLSRKQKGSNNRNKARLTQKLVGTNLELGLNIKQNGMEEILLLLLSIMQVLNYVFVVIIKIKK